MRTTNISAVVGRRCNQEQMMVTTISATSKVAVHDADRVKCRTRAGASLQRVLQLQPDLWLPLVWLRQEC